jgi:hypothetical protein
MNNIAPPVYAAANTTLAPPAGLVVANPSPQGGQPLFCLFTQDWISMQTFIVQALQLPINTTNFEDKYGTFTDEQEIKDCVAAMAAVQALSADFGDPMALIKELATNPAILQTDTAPQQLYIHIVWFATKLYQTAVTFNQTLGQFMTLLNPANCGNKAQCGAVLVEILTGQGGLQSTAANMVTLANDLVAALAQFTLKLVPSTTTMASYTASSSKFYKDVADAITTDTNDVETFQQEADTAYKLWRDLTISAVTTSIGVLVLTGGLAWPVSATLAGVLGDQATKARAAYDNACAERDAAAADEQKKIQLKFDLGAFNLQMSTVNNAAANFQTTLQQVSAVWAQIGVNLNFIATNFTPDQLGDLSWVMQALALDRATQDWQTIANKAEEYTGNSLVTYNIVGFGDKLPPNTTPT